MVFDRNQSLHSSGSLINFIFQVHQTALEDDIGMMYLSTVDTSTVAVCTTDGHVTYVDDRNHPQQQT